MGQSNVRVSVVILDAVRSWLLPVSFENILCNYNYFSQENLPKKKTHMARSTFAR